MVKNGLKIWVCTYISSFKGKRWLSAELWPFKISKTDVIKNRISAFFPKLYTFLVILRSVTVLKKCTSNGDYKAARFISYPPFVGLWYCIGSAPVYEKSLQMIETTTICGRIVRMVSFLATFSTNTSFSFTESRFDNMTSRRTAPIISRGEPTICKPQRDCACEPELTNHSNNGYYYQQVDSPDY